MNKTVYFLGAGFSKPAGGPVQNEIIETILSPEFESYAISKNITTAFKRLISFLRDDLYIGKKKYSKVELEDIFTPIDRCIADNKSFGHYGSRALPMLREDLHILMAAAIQFLVDQPQNNQHYIQQFASYINRIAQSRMQDNEDKIAIITSNWDILLDNALQRAIDTNRIDQLAVVDYCCYISSLRDDSKIKPGLLALGEGGYNIKLLKLHGSTNWLHCPMCQRMYVIFHQKPMLDNTKYYCTHCMENFKLGAEQPSIKLKGNLVVPTFLKDLNNVQIKLIWQNAGIELSEANKILFIGYSLPAADFEIRQLFSHYIPAHVNIEVIVFPGEMDIDGLKNRYRYFFGRRHITFIVKEVPAYIRDLCNVTSTEFPA